MSTAADVVAERLNAEAAFLVQQQVEFVGK